MSATDAKTVGAGLVPARSVSAAAGRDKPCPYNHPSAVAFNCKPL